ncbi:MAG TPA: class I SAM-dependent methyltransferase family protein [Candidatus Nanoarchaeia archaeon]|nr:class I SAM-dependent methyltransferase family protein [Candidatus Nanoarchaeia archaeon]
MKCIKVRLEEAESVRIMLLKNSILDNKFKIENDKDFVYFPVKKKFAGYKLFEKNLEEKKIKFGIKEILKKELTKKELSNLKRSMDIIGGIAVIEIDKSLLHKKKIIAESILKFNKNVKTVFRKLSPHEGKFRVRGYEFLAGINKTETIHRESGLLFKLDISKVYFSPRLNNDRLNISKMVKSGEDVLVMFSGIGAYCFVISKYSKARYIYGVEINPVAHKYAEESLKLNKLSNIKFLFGDVKNICPRLKIKFDRILMPLPKNANEYLDIAARLLKKGGIIHFYSFAEKEKFDSAIEEIKNKLNVKILDIVKCGQVSPNNYRVRVDFKIKK